jgi:hypothetical protein
MRAEDLVLAHHRLEFGEKFALGAIVAAKQTTATGEREMETTKQRRDEMKREKCFPLY